MSTILSKEVEEFFRFRIGEGSLNLFDDAGNEFVDGEEHVTLTGENPSNRVFESGLIEFSFEELFAECKRSLIVVFGGSGPSFAVGGSER